MVHAEIRITLNKDVNDITESIDYYFSGLVPSVFIGIYIGDNLFFQTFTDSDGYSEGIVNTIPSIYHDHLRNIGGLSMKVKHIYMPTTGLIAKQEVIVEDTFNDGEEEFPDGSLGTHRIEVRYI